MNGQLTNTTPNQPYSNPTLKIFIFGVGILWFDQTTNYADFGFIKIPNDPHPLYLDICENGTIIYSEKLEENAKIILNGKADNRGMGNRYYSEIVQDLTTILDG